MNRLFLVLSLMIVFSACESITLINEFEPRMPYYPDIVPELIYEVDILGVDEGHLYKEHLLIINEDSISCIEASTGNQIWGITEADVDQWINLEDRLLVRVDNEIYEIDILSGDMSLVLNLNINNEHFYYSETDVECLDDELYYLVSKDENTAEELELVSRSLDGSNLNQLAIPNAEFIEQWPKEIAIDESESTIYFTITYDDSSGSKRQLLSYTEGDDNFSIRYEWENPDYRAENIVQVAQNMLFVLDVQGLFVFELPSASILHQISQNFNNIRLATNLNRVYVYTPGQYFAFSAEDGTYEHYEVQFVDIKQEYFAQNTPILLSAHWYEDEDNQIETGLCFVDAINAQTLNALPYDNIDRLIYGHFIEEDEIALFVFNDRIVAVRHGLPFE